jgi:hypothetical protein
MRIDPAEYLALDLRAHELLRGVPLHDVSVVDLPGGGEGRTVGELRTLMDRMAPGPVVSGLMALRQGIGDLLRWDTAEACAEDSFVSRVPERDRLASEIAPGTQKGMFRVLYQFPREAVSEVRNATAQAFLCTALVPRPSGYRFYWAVYVKPTSWRTPFYMAAIEPFRRWLVYPSMLRRLRAAWIGAYSRSGRATAT